ncbi:MAG: ribonuclease HI family protein [Phycisphaerae bacterium]
MDYSILRLQFDGGSRGNPGAAGCGITLTTPSGELVYELGDYLGLRTNNYAEYMGLIRGVDAAVRLGAKKLEIKADSELVVRQILGIYRVKNAALKPLYQQAVHLLTKIPSWSIQHVYRDANVRPDELANMAMNRQRAIYGGPGAEILHPQETHQ